MDASIDQIQKAVVSRESYFELEGLITPTKKNDFQLFSAYDRL